MTAAECKKSQNENHRSSTVHKLYIGSLDIGLAAAIVTVIAVALISHLKQDARRNNWLA
jgi:hypothetical protein